MAFWPPTCIYRLFAAIQQDLNTSAASVSASLSLFLAGFALGQLFWGPLSDRYGRKPILLAGLAIFALGCLGMLWVRDATLMLVLRFCPGDWRMRRRGDRQAMVTDYYPAQRTNRIFRDDHAAGRALSGAGAVTRQLAVSPSGMAGYLRHPVRYHHTVDAAGFFV